MSVSVRVISLYFPGIIGPPGTNIAGIFRRIAAINIPGTILSQPGIITIASNWWASIMHSMESAITSRLIREYFMPLCP